MSSIHFYSTKESKIIQLFYKFLVLLWLGLSSIKEAQIYMLVVSETIDFPKMCPIFVGSLQVRAQYKKLEHSTLLNLSVDKIFSHMFTY